jgi:glycosyltransferase involved in cell wall biosynthesis
MIESPPLKQRLCIVFYHGNDWDGVRARQRYLMQALSAHFRILYLDGTPARRGWITVRRPQPGVTVVAGLVSVLAALERRSLGWLAHLAGQVFSLFFRRRAESFIFWNAENWACPFRFIPHERLVFDCIDPSFTEDAGIMAAFGRRESQLLKAADLVFASASSLFDSCSRENAHTHLLNNACEPADYTGELLQAAQRPAWWPAAGGPVAAYLGSLDRRFDYALMTKVAQRLPQISFILAGTVIPECAAMIEGLQTLPNVICPGRISVEHGRYLIAHCSAGIIPFLRGPMNDGVNPVKLYAYALMGKPIVGTPIRELSERPESALIGHSPEEFANHLLAVVDGLPSAPAPDRLRGLARKNTWKVRAITVVEVFQQHGWSGAPASPLPSPL